MKPEIKTQSEARSLLPISRTPSVNNNTASAGDSTLKGCERS